MSGSAVIMRPPMAEQVSPCGCAPRRMRRMLYCVEVTPQSRVLRWNARCSASAVRRILSSASSSTLEKGCSCTISSFRPAILQDLPGQCAVSETRTRERTASLSPPDVESRFPPFSVAAATARKGWDTRNGCSWLLLDDFEFDVELDIIANCGGGELAADAKVGALDGGGCGKPG